MQVEEGREAHVPVQLEVQDRVSKMADLDEQMAEMHKRLEKQLLQQLETQELLRCASWLTAGYKTVRTEKHVFLAPRVSKMCESSL